MKKHEDKENIPTGSEPSGSIVPRTPMHQLKRSTSNVHLKNNSRLPLASKDRNRSQSGFNLKQQLVQGHVGGGVMVGQNKSKRPASNSFVKNMPDSKLKKYGSVLGVNYPHLTKTKSLVLKDASDGSQDNGEESDDYDDEEGNPLAAKLRSRLTSGVEDENEDDGSSGLLLGGGLKKLIKLHESDNQDTEEVPQIETAPEKVPELEHIPNGYEQFEDEEIVKLATYTSPFLRFADREEDDSDSTEGERLLIPLDFGGIDESPSKKQELMATQENIIANKTIVDELGTQADEIQFSFDIGKGLSSNELQSLLD
ncbi:securin Ecym_4305 [Eremothecium cymbalariae DBVPG|uniref:Securin n=1 Tax=Eremothecium cymbalariae (strain CBS 270.75 / DBVPG 7215 / KCTC 17166 / NRRL Y-17582) TaxID=931890 RepID=G8JTL5_ERECY|nr:hypothetical protein Ecym_4305 [Eremothecium cymbalariae DBVPG\